jgi:hypothetical protein
MLPGKVPPHVFTSILVVFHLCHISTCYTALICVIPTMCVVINGKVHAYVYTAGKSHVTMDFTHVENVIFL